MIKKINNVNHKRSQLNRRPCLAFLTADGFQDTELFVTYDICKQGGLNCFLVSVDNLKYINSSAGITVKVDSQISLLSLTDFDGIIVPSGSVGVKNLLLYNEVTQLIKAFDKQQLLVASICAGPVILAKANVLKQKRFTCFPSKSVINYCQTHGGKYVADKKVIKDGNIITSQSPLTAKDFGEAIVKYFDLQKK